MQLRQDNLAGDHFSLVGFQTQMKWGEQARVLRLIPGLEQAEFVRFGMVHRNTYVNGPTVLRETWQIRSRADLFFAGQMSGVEGYVESAASGLLAGLQRGGAGARAQPLSAPPRTTAIGALAYYVSHADPAHYQPSNITFGIMAPLDAAAAAEGAAQEASEREELAMATIARWPALERSGDVGRRDRADRRMRRASTATHEAIARVPQVPRAQPQPVAAHGARLRAATCRSFSVTSPPSRR